MRVRDIALVPDEFVIARMQLARRIVRHVGVCALNADEQRVLAREVKNLGGIGQDDEKMLAFRIVCRAGRDGTSSVARR